jgi:hypothetical protein
VLAVYFLGITSFTAMTALLALYFEPSSTSARRDGMDVRHRRRRHRHGAWAWCSAGWSGGSARS